VLGTQNWTSGGNPIWSCLAYTNSGGTPYSHYYTTAGDAATGTGFLSNNTITGIGSGGWGGIIGSWTRGEVMGSISAGDFFASYSLGNNYTSGISADIINTEGKRIPAFSVTSSQIKVYNDGVAVLVDGKARVNFDRDFKSLIGKNIPTITVTPMGKCNGLYITEVDNEGFSIAEFNDGNTNVPFSYIVIGKRIDADTYQGLPEDLAKPDFDENMKGVMFNENNLEQTATPIWWDGKQLRFDPIPETKRHFRIDYDIKDAIKEVPKNQAPTVRTKAKNMGKPFFEAEKQSIKPKDSLKISTDF